jgi:hypothetical protein
MRTAFLVSLIVLCGCAQLHEQRPIAEEEQLGSYQVTNGTEVPNISVRARRYTDHVSLLAECFLLEGGTAASRTVQSARAQCQSTLSNAVAEFLAHNTWQLSGLLPQPARWSSSIGSDYVLTLTGTVRLVPHAR